MNLKKNDYSERNSQKKKISINDSLDKVKESVEKLTNPEKYEKKKTISKSGIGVIMSILLFMLFFCTKLSSLLSCLINLKPESEQNLNIDLESSEKENDSSKHQSKRGRKKGSKNSKTIKKEEIFKNILCKTEQAAKVLKEIIDGFEEYEKIFSLTDQTDSVTDNQNTDKLKQNSDLPLIENNS